MSFYAMHPFSPHIYILFIHIYSFSQLTISVILNNLHLTQSIHSSLRTTSSSRRHKTRMILKKRRVNLPEIHSNRSSTPSLEDHDDDLTNAQKNLLRDLTKHKTNILKHEGLANHFNTLSSSPGPALPNVTKPILNLRDQKVFSSICLNKLDEINKEYQKQVCSLLGAHHTEMAKQSRLFLDIRLRDIDSIYNNSTIRKRLDHLSKDLSIDAYTDLRTKSKRNHGQKRPHP